MEHGQRPPRTTPGRVPPQKVPPQKVQTCAELHVTQQQHAIALQSSGAVALERLPAVHQPAVLVDAGFNLELRHWVRREPGVPAPTD